MDTKRTGWERENRTHFDEIVVNYDKARWEYPGELFEDVFEYSGAGEGKKALEIGAGTGKATTPFLNAGYNVKKKKRVKQNFKKHQIKRFLMHTQLTEWSNLYGLHPE